MVKYLYLLKLLSVIGLSTLVNSFDLSCSQMKKLTTEYFDETTSNGMICLSFYESNAWNSLQSNNNKVGLWNLDAEFCNTLCKPVCDGKDDLFNPKISVQCAELVYLEYGYKHWKSWDKCKQFSQCSIYTDGLITGTGISYDSQGSLVDAAITGTGVSYDSEGSLVGGLTTGVSYDSQGSLIDAAITGTGISYDSQGSLIVAAITGTGVSYDSQGSLIDAAITGTGVSYDPK